MYYKNNTDFENEADKNDFFSTNFFSFKDFISLTEDRCFDVWLDVIDNEILFLQDITKEIEDALLKLYNPNLMPKHFISIDPFSETYIPEKPLFVVRDKSREKDELVYSYFQEI